LLTLVERKTLYTIVVKLKGRHSKLLATAAINALKPLKERVKTITLDNGLEFAEHQRIAKRLEADIYFAHPYASWERGIN
jgi:IS30 family transposase